FRQDVTRPLHAVAAVFPELVRDRQQQRDEGMLVLRIDLEDIETDALCSGGIVEQAVALRFLERGGHASLRDGLQFHGLHRQWSRTTEKPNCTNATNHTNQQACWF